MLLQPPRITYLGVIHQPDHAEYGFQITGKDKAIRFLVLAVLKSFFQKRLLLVQEAPDLCFQKVRDDLESSIPRLRDFVYVTESDIVNYRASHPNERPPRRPFGKAAKSA